MAAAMALLAPATPGLLAGAGTGGVALIMLGDGVRTAAISLLMFLVGSLERRSVRGLPLAAAVGTQAVMIALFLVSRPTLTPDGSILVDSAGRWTLAAHDLVFAGYAEWTVVFAARALRREAGRTRSKPVRIGLRLFVAACAVGVVWSAWTADDVVDVLRSGVQNGSEDLVSNALGALCTALIVAGALGVKEHALFTSARIRYRAHRTYRQLAPLWEALCAELPQVALESAGRASLGLGSRFHDLDFALYRRVIEIHDVRLALRPYAPERNLLTAELEPARRGRGAARRAARGAGTRRGRLDRRRPGQPPGRTRPRRSPGRRRLAANGDRLGDHGRRGCPGWPRCPPRSPGCGPEPPGRARGSAADGAYSASSAGASRPAAGSFSRRAMTSIMSLTVPMPLGRFTARSARLRTCASRSAPSSSSSFAMAAP